MLRGFFLGVIVTLSLIVALYFFKFWKRSKDSLFLAFGIAFFIEGVNRTAYLFLERPNDSMPVIYMVRLIAFLLILGAIIKKNAGRS